MSDHVSRLSLSTLDDRLVAVGEIDAHTCPDLSAALDPLPDGDDIHLAMAGVDFMDSSGLRVLIDAHERAEAAGRKLFIEQPSKSVARILEISGLNGHLNVVTG